MKKRVKKFLAGLFSVLAWVVGFFVGGVLFFIHPCYLLVTSFLAGTLTKSLLAISIIKIFLASTVGGAIWCIFDIIAGLFREIDTE